MTRAPIWTRPGAFFVVALTLAAALGGGAWWQAWHASPNAVDAETLRAAALAADRIALLDADVTAGAGARLTWRAVPGATRYHVEVLDAAGDVVHAAATRDTTMALPDTLRPPAGATWEWSVRARLADGGTRRSDAGRLRAP
ncbi:hypothetical protein [Roseisolibacter agri]|uniref:Uncharacterized protein n=1 Tax=Roseisolibacter agri TaxID=2014610 RepID=A0AA37Q5A5_9BACT|nr:hypothetical protein [Roseisolibacter agri]GLC24032.1 hypothetical protein rosag_05450 [Roseisolibacter agri]